MKKIFLFAILCLVSTYAIAQARLTGKLNNFMGGNAIVIRLTDTGRLNDTLSVNADGTFAASLNVEKPGNAYLLFEEQHQSMEFFLEDGMKADLQITFTETLVDGKPQTDMSVTYSGDNKDCYDFIKQNGVMEHYKNWPFERINGMPFKTYREQIQHEYEETRAKLNKVKSIAFRRMAGKEVDEQLTRDICRWAWGKNKQKDADFDHWMASFDHNDPQNDMTYNYWRRYEDIHPLPADAPAIARYERLKQAFDNQEIINRLADSMIQNTLKDAPENMDEELAAYKATSTNDNLTNCRTSFLNLSFLDIGLFNSLSVDKIKLGFLVLKFICSITSIMLVNDVIRHFSLNIINLSINSKSELILLPKQNI